MKINEVYTPLLSLLGFTATGKVKRRTAPAQKRANRVRRKRKYRY